MPGGLASKAAEQRIPDVVLPSPPGVNSDGRNGALRLTYSYSLSKRKVHASFSLLPVFVAAVLLLWILHLCRVVKSRKVLSPSHMRRLSGRGEGEKEENVARTRARDVCEALEGPAPSREEEAGSQALPPGTPPVPSEPIAQEEQPRKRKEKTKWLEEAAEQPRKKARREPSPSTSASPTDEKDDGFHIVEQAVVETIQTLGPDVENWALDFNEEELLMSPPAAVTPGAPLDDTDEEESPLGPEKNLQLLLEAAKQLQGREQLPAVPPTPKKSVSLSGEEEASVTAQPLEERHSEEKEKPQPLEVLPSTSRTSHPGTSAGAVSARPPLPLASHKYYRLPCALASVRLPFFNGAASLQYPAESKGLPAKLGTLRKLLAKQELGENDVLGLVNTASILLEYAANWDPSQFEGQHPNQLMESAARRLLVADGLMSICEILGPAMNQKQWWGLLMARLRIPEISGPRRMRSHAIDWRPLYKEFREAMELYSQGVRPEAAQVVRLKRLIFCDPGICSEFRNPRWEPWRDDDKEFRRASGPQ